MPHSTYISPARANKVAQESMADFFFFLSTCDDAHMNMHWWRGGGGGGLGEGDVHRVSILGMKEWSGARDDECNVKKTEEWIEFV